MGATQGFFNWWFFAAGIGGWVLFLVLAIGALAWMVYSTQTRRIRAIGWMLGAILPTLLLIPSALYSLSPGLRAQVQQDLQELFFYLGVIGGVVPLVVAVGYGITYQGLRGCERGHPPYDASLGECPICAQERIAAQPPAPPSPPVQVIRERPPAAPAAPVRPSKPKASAWLIDERTNQTHQLNQGDTRVGRSRQANDLVFNDRAVSREHLLIREEQGHFTIYDRGARSGTFVNGTRLQGPILLAHDDLIEIGDTRLRFITSRH